MHMRGVWKKVIALLLAMLLLSAVSVVLVGCGEEETETTATATATTAAISSQDIENRVQAVLASNPTSGDYAANAITGTALADKLADPATAATIYLLDIRSPEAYSAGYIEGSVNVPFKDWAAPDNLETYPQDKKIVVICSTGGASAQVVAGLRMLGYDAAALKAGINGWTQTATTQEAVDTINNASYSVANTPANAAASAPAQEAFTAPDQETYDGLAQKANELASDMPGSGDYANNVVSATDLNNMMQDGDIFILDIRAAADFESVGHIEGAVNVPYAALAVQENLDMLPMDKKIVVVCYTGNTAGQATMLLNLLGYDAAVLSYGMMSWNHAPPSDSFVSSLESADNPIVE